MTHATVKIDLPEELRAVLLSRPAALRHQRVQPRRISDWLNGFLCCAVLTALIATAAVAAIYMDALVRWLERGGLR